MLPSLLVFAIFQSSPVVQLTAAVCQDIQRVELSLARGVSREVCVSPGLLTGFVFDATVIVDLEDELRFAEVTRGRTSISLMPPGDGLAGERFRLTARFVDGASVTFVLVVHSGRATRQVEVYRDKRTRESFQHELTQERPKTQQLQQEKEWLQYQLEQLRVECGDPGGLLRLIANGSILRGVHVREFTKQFLGFSESSLLLVRGLSYRSEFRVAVEVLLLNSSREPWRPVAASLVDAKGEELKKGMRLWVSDGAIPPNERGLVVVEVEVDPDESPGHVTLSFREEGPRTITFPKVMVP